MESPHHIALRGVEVHNLKGIDLDIPHRKLVVLCGVSGSGKSSLALDTLYAEGQRRYIESFSAYTRQFLQRLERPDADRIDGIPPAIAVTSRNGHRSSRSTVGTATETNDYLRLLFARIGQVYCVRCGQQVRRHTAQNSAEMLRALPQGTRYLIAFGLEPSDDENPGRLAAGLREEGFVRVIVGDRLVHLGETSDAGALVATAGTCDVVVDRLTAGMSAEDRIRDSLEMAFTRGKGRCVVFVEESGVSGDGAPAVDGLPRGTPCLLDGQPWRRIVFSTQLACGDCGLEYPMPEPRLYSFNSPLGACPKCEGFGNIIDLDMELIVPDRRKSIQEGAIAPWNSPAYAHELDELLALAPDYGIPVDVPFARLEPEHLERIQNGVPERNFGGLRGFFAWLERRKYKMHIRVFLSRWRSYRPCPACGGTRLRPEALATRLGGKNFAEIMSMKVQDAAAVVGTRTLSPVWF
jgi:excinuclease ABC subunit A